MFDLLQLKFDTFLSTRGSNGGCYESLRKPSRTGRVFTPEKKVTILRTHLADKVPLSDLYDEYELSPSALSLAEKCSRPLDYLTGALRLGLTAFGASRKASADRAHRRALGDHRQERPRHC